MPEILCMKIGAMEVQRYQCRASEVIYSDVLSFDRKSFLSFDRKSSSALVYIYMFMNLLVN